MALLENSLGSRSKQLEVTMVQSLCVSLPTFAKTESYINLRVLGRLNRMVAWNANIDISSMLLEHYYFKQTCRLNLVLGGGGVGWGGGEAVLTASYLIDRTPSTLHNGSSPYEILHGCKPNYDQLRVFGSACYVHCVSRDKD